MFVDGIEAVSDRDADDETSSTATRTKPSIIYLHLHLLTNAIDSDSPPSFHRRRPRKSHPSDAAPKLRIFDANGNINPWQPKSSLWLAPLRLPGVGVGYRDTKWEVINPMVASLARSSRKPRKMECAKAVNRTEFSFSLFFYMS